MNKLSKFFHELFNPHCQHCVNERAAQLEIEREIRENNRICDSCESLKMMNAQLLEQVKTLVDKIANPNPEKPVVQEDREMKPIRPAFIPPSVRRNMMEKEDRAKSRAMRDAATPDPEPTRTAVVGAMDHKAELADIEKELEDVGQEKAH